MLRAAGMLFVPAPVHNVTWHLQGATDMLTTWVQNPGHHNGDHDHTQEQKHS